MRQNSPVGSENFKIPFKTIEPQKVGKEILYGFLVSVSG